MPADLSAPAPSALTPSSSFSPQPGACFKADSRVLPRSEMDEGDHSPPSASPMIDVQAVATLQYRCHKIGSALSRFFILGCDEARPAFPSHATYCVAMIAETELRVILKD